MLHGPNTQSALRSLSCLPVVVIQSHGHSQEVVLWTQGLSVPCKFSRDEPSSLITALHLPAVSAQETLASSQNPSHQISAHRSSIGTAPMSLLDSDSIVSSLGSKTSSKSAVDYCIHLMTFVL